MLIGERLVILFPSLIFFVIIMFKIILEHVFENDLSTALVINDETLYKKILKMNSLLVLFIDGVILFITNGLIVIFELNEIIVGVFFLLFGVIVCLLGIICTVADRLMTVENKSLYSLSDAMVDLSIYLNVGEIGYLLLYDNPLVPSFMISISQNITINLVPWIGFALFIFIAYLLLNVVLSEKL